MKIFISMPMNGRSDEAIKEEFERHASFLKSEYGEDTEILKSVFDEPASPIVYLAESIKVLDKADIVYFAKGWEQTRGCNVERHVAEVYGKAIRTEM